LQENLANAKITFSNVQKNLENTKNLRSMLDSNLQIAQQREENLRTLFQPGALPRVDYLEAQERLNRAKTEMIRNADEITRIENNLTEAKDKITSLEKDIAAQIQEINQAEQTYQTARNQSIRLTSERQSEILTQINKRQEELTTVAGQLEQAKKQKDGETIKAPVAGTIYKIKATKGPVQSGERISKRISTSISISI
ncbi:MAG: TolC family protein, partial [Dolichospermum sp.]